MQNDTSASTSIPSGAAKRSTVYIAGIAPEVNEEQLLAAFITFGDIIDIKIPHEQHEPSKSRGFAFITFSNPHDAQEAIDNYDLNELPGYQGRGRFLKCSLAQPSKYQSTQEGGKGFDRAVWDTEEWKKDNQKEQDQQQQQQEIEVADPETEQA